MHWNSEWKINGKKCIDLTSTTIKKLAIHFFYDNKPKTEEYFVRTT